MRILRCLAVAGCLLLASLARADDAALVEASLDEFHESAARADTAAYFGVMTEDVVFLGTDASERWQGQAFRDFVTSHFSAGRGWTYVPVQRDIIVAADDDTAWFDELLENEGLGTCRGSGVLVKSAGGWKIAQYNLSVPVPNAIVGKVAADIAALQAVPVSDSGTATAANSPPVPASAATADTPHPATEPAEPAPTGNDPGCSKKRFKTNRKAGCS